MILLLFCGIHGTQENIQLNQIKEHLAEAPKIFPPVTKKGTQIIFFSSDCHLLNIFEQL